VAGLEKIGMSTINESLRKLEERGAFGQTALPAGVVATPPRTSAAPGQRRQTALVLALALAVTAAGLGWSEWQRWQIAPQASAATNSQPVHVQVPMPEQAPGQTPLQSTLTSTLNSTAQGPAQTASKTSARDMTQSGAIHLAVTEAVGPKPVAHARPGTPAPVNPVNPLNTAIAEASKPPVVGLPASTGNDKAAVKAAPLETDVAALSPAEPMPQASTSAGKKPSPASAKQTTPEQKADALYLRALHLLQESRGSDARLALEDALEQNPAQHNARQLLAALRVEDRQLGRAETLLTDGLPYHPPAAALVALARLKVERGEDAAALRLLSDNLEIGADDGDYHALMAALLMRQGRPEQAAEHYRRAIARQPAQGHWWAGLGLALAHQKDRRAEAIQALKQARQSGKLPSVLADRVDAQLLTLLRSEDQP
jgi:MSHA biogenesis protein MshN